MTYTSQELIDRAAAVIRPRQMANGRIHGDVGAAAVSLSGRLYTGVCIDTTSWGLCAERSALAAMVTDGEYGIDTVVAVWRDSATGRLHVLPPCGVCREFMRQLDDRNLNARILLGGTEHQTLAQLLPHHEWPAPLT